MNADIEGEKFTFTKRVKEYIKEEIEKGTDTGINEMEIRDLPIAFSHDNDENGWEYDLGPLENYLSKDIRDGIERIYYELKRYSL